MRQIFAAAVLAGGCLILGSCGGADVAPKKADAAPPNAATSTPPTVTNPAAAEAEVKKLLKDIETALSKNDADALDKIYAPDYVLVNQDGVMQTRQERLASIKSGDIKYESFAYSDITVRSFGETAVVNNIATFKAMSKGKPLAGRFRVMSVWVKGKDGWRQVGAQATQIADAAK